MKKEKTVDVEMKGPKSKEHLDSQEVIDFICEQENGDADDLYRGIPHIKFVGEIADLGYMDEAEAVKYAIDKFLKAVREINMRLLGHDINIGDYESYG
jgi:hypothetical protein